MKDGVLTGTMADMKWTDVEAYARKNALVLLPVGVIEEHGPQLPLATDIYTAHLHCVFIQEKLRERQVEAVIAPPFYWGVCQSTGSFIGSFRIRKETAVSLLADILASLAAFGFRDVYGINAHGDIEQNIALLEAFRKAQESLQINCRYAISRSVMHHYGLNGREPFVCPVDPQDLRVSASEYPDVHAGDIETATIHAYYPHLVDTEKAKALPPVRLGDDKIMAWLFGGQTAELSPEGYLGAPAEYEGADALGNLRDIARRVTDAVVGTLKDLRG